MDARDVQGWVDQITAELHYVRKQLGLVGQYATDERARDCGRRAGDALARALELAGDLADEAKAALAE